MYEQFAWNVTCIVWIKIFQLNYCLFSEKGIKLRKVNDWNM